jgi:hypothetical protein
MSGVSLVAPGTESVPGSWVILGFSWVCSGRSRLAGPVLGFVFRISIFYLLLSSSLPLQSPRLCVKLLFPFSVLSESSVVKPLLSILRSLCGSSPQPQSCHPDRSAAPFAARSGGIAAQSNRLAAVFDFPFSIFALPQFQPLNRLQYRMPHNRQRPRANLIHGILRRMPVRHIVRRI